MAMHRKKSKKHPRPSANSGETRASDAVTVAWIVTLVTVLLCDLVIVVAHVFLLVDPDQQRLNMLKELLLFGGTVVGLLSLGLLPVVYRVRRVPPPPGLVVFGACLAIAPILASFIRYLQ